MPESVETPAPVSTASAAPRERGEGSRDRVGRAGVLLGDRDGRHPPCDHPLGSPRGQSVGGAVFRDVTGALAEWTPCASSEIGVGGRRAAGRLPRSDGCRAAPGARTRRRPVHRRVGEGDRACPGRRPPPPVGAGAGEVARRCRPGCSPIDAETPVYVVACRRGRVAHRLRRAPRRARGDAPTARSRRSPTSSRMRDRRRCSRTSSITRTSAPIFRSCGRARRGRRAVAPRCADPLYRRSVRVSMGTVFQVPWTRLPEWPEARGVLHDAGFHLAALALSDDAVGARRVRRRPARAGRAPARRRGRRPEPARPAGGGHGRDDPDGGRRRLAQRRRRERRRALGAASSRSLTLGRLDLLAAVRRPASLAGASVVTGIGVGSLRGDVVARGLVAHAPQHPRHEVRRAPTRGPRRAPARHVRAGSGSGCIGWRSLGTFSARSTMRATSW